MIIECGDIVTQWRGMSKRPPHGASVRATAKQQKRMAPARKEPDAMLAAYEVRNWVERFNSANLALPSCFLLEGAMRREFKNKGHMLYRCLSKPASFLRIFDALKAPGCCKIRLSFLQN